MHARDLVAQVNPLTRELLVKLVYYGPGLGGKTTSLQHIHAASPPESRGQLVSLATPVDRTLYFDFLPLRAHEVREHHVRLQLFTVPGQVYFNATRKLVLTGVDGLVFVADSQRERFDANLESMENLVQNLSEQGRSLEDTPIVFQFNKRDLPGVMGLDELNRSLNPDGRPSFGTIATDGDGVMTALDVLVQASLDDLEARGVLGGPQKSAPESPEFSRAEKALEEQIGAATEAVWKTSIERAIAQGTLPVGNSTFPSAVEPLKSAPRPGGGGQALSRSSIPFRASPPGPSWAPLFPDAQGEAIRQIEADLAAARLSDAIVRVDGLVGDVLRAVARDAGSPVDQGALLVPWLGVPGVRWLAFRKIVRRARDGSPIDIRDALEAFAVLLLLRTALD